jgi:hypothetical protein
VSQLGRQLLEALRERTSRQDDIVLPARLGGTPVQEDGTLGLLVRRVSDDDDVKSGA